jgi:hypothetical protein
MRRTASGLGPGVLLIAFLPTLAWAAGNVQTGKEVAERWCASCHLVSAEQTQGSADAPSFMSIAEHSGEEVEWLKAFLVEPPSSDARDEPYTTGNSGSDCLFGCPGKVALTLHYTDFSRCRATDARGGGRA